MLRRTSMVRLLVVGFVILSVVSCNCGGEVIINQPDGGTTLDGGKTDAGTMSDAGLIACVPPDVLIALDRTLTMHRQANGDTPADTDAGHALTKWSMAINGIEQLTASPFDEGIRFGLELWPKQNTGCTTLAQRIQGTMANNPSCEGPELVVPVGLRTGVQISSVLDPETTPICLSTPTGDALLGARGYLQSAQDAGRQQFIVLVTDGADWDVSCPNPNPLGVVDQIADAGISTLIVGFSAEVSIQNGVGKGFLNDMACAGGTAKNFSTACVRNDAGYFRAAPTDAGLFFVATNASELVDGLRAFGKTICCNCIN